MSIQAVAWALDQDLPARPKLVLVSIANHANHTDGYCWLKAETIAAEASCSPRAVFNFVGDLIRNGYLRKAPRRATDGRQRANDYWIMFAREPVKWIKDRGAGEVDEADEDETDDAIAEVSADTDAEAAQDDVTQDVVPPDAPGACGSVDDSQPLESTQLPAGAVGPHAPACSHKDSAKPSKTNPEKAGTPKGPPRGYRPPPPPPPQPVGSTISGNGDFIFVFYPSKAYDAWKAVKERELRRPFSLKTMREGRWGWYFPSLFPPEAKPKPPPEGGTFATEDDLDHLAKTG